MNLKQQRARLTRLCFGRPISLDYEVGPDKTILQIRSDDRTKCIHMIFTEKDAVAPDDQIYERLLAPAIANLDDATFPERFKRKTDALKIELDEASGPNADIVQHT